MSNVIIMQDRCTATYPSPNNFVMRKLRPFTLITVFGNVLALEYVSTTESTTELIESTKLVKKDIFSFETREKTICHNSFLSKQSGPDNWLHKLRVAPGTLLCRCHGNKFISTDHVN